MDSWVIYLAIVAACVVALVFLRFGAKAATFAAGGLALVIAYFAGQRGAAAKIENEQLRDRVNNDDKREASEQRANSAADTVRNAPSVELRKSDPFERR